MSHETIQTSIQHWRERVRAKGGDPEAILASSWVKTQIGQLAVLKLAAQGIDVSTLGVEVDNYDNNAALFELAYTFDEIDRVKAETAIMRSEIATLRAEREQAEQQIASRCAESEAIEASITPEQRKLHQEISGIRNEILALLSEKAGYQMQEATAHRNLLLLVPLAVAVGALPPEPSHLASDPVAVRKFVESHLATRFASLPPLS